MAQYNIDDFIQSCIWFLSTDGAIQRANAAALELCRQSMEQIKGRKLGHFFSPESYQTFNDHLVEVSSKRSVTCKVWMFRQHDEQLCLDLTSTLLPDGQLLSLGRDITDQKRLEAEILDSHKEKEELIAAITSIMIQLDGHNRVTGLNRIAERVFGINARKTNGKSLSDLPIVWEWEQLDGYLTQCRERKEPVRTDDIPFTCPDGSAGYLGFTITPMERSKDKDHLLLIGADITKKRHMAQQLAQAQKLEAVGQLAAGIAHEINTPIQFVHDSTTFLQTGAEDLLGLIDDLCALIKDFSPNSDQPETILQRMETIEEEWDLGFLRERLPKALKLIDEGLMRVATIVKAMKEFSHPDTGEQCAADLNQAIENTLIVAHNEYKFIAQVEKDLGHLPPVTCYIGKLKQVFLNLIVNAAHAIAAREDLNKGLISVRTWVEGDDVLVAISDNGIGIPSEIIERIFDPFFTTKEVGKGTGQGLAIAWSVITEDHFGNIIVNSTCGKGTTFKIQLPIAGHTGTTTA